VSSIPTSPLAIADFRRLWLARCMATLATVGMVVLIGYQTYDVARGVNGMDIPTASLLLGLLGAAQFVPLALLTPIAGVAADMFDRRHVVMFANVIDAGVALAIGLATLNGWLTLPLLFVLAALHGTARVFNGPALSAIGPNIVPPALLPKAIALGSMSWQLGSVAGPALGGLLFAHNASLPYFISASMLLASALLVGTIRPVRAVHEGPAQHPYRLVIEGFGYIKSQRFLLGCISLDLFAVLMGGATALLPVFARDILHVGSEGLGVMRGAPAIGAALVGLYLSWRPFESNVGVKMLWSVVAFGAATIAFAISRDFWFSLLCLGLIGAADMISVFVRTSLVQLNTPDEKRGRVSAISGLAISASNELGELQSGLAAALLGATGAVVFGGAGAIIITAIWALTFPELRRARTFAPQFMPQTATKEQPT